MKKFLILCAFCGMFLLSGCVSISNIDIQKLNQKAVEYMEAGDYEKAIARLESILVGICIEDAKFDSRDNAS